MKPTKPIFIALMLCLISSMQAVAQIEKGKNVLAGFVGYRSTDDGGSVTSSVYTNSSYSISPSYGHLLSNNFELGISIGYTWNKSKVSSYSIPAAYSEIERSSFFIMPYIKMYQNLAEHFYFSAALKLGYSAGTEKQTYSDSFISNENKSDVSTVSTQIAPGLTYAFNNHWAIEYSIGALFYSSTKTTDKTTNTSSTQNNFVFGFLSAENGLGIKYYF